MPKLVDLTGRVFGRLTVENRESKPGAQRAYWKCRCACGATAVVTSNNLKSGNTTSCGCFFREKASARIREANFRRARRPPGMCRHPIYRAWADMIQRCNNPCSKSFKSYGGRGVRVHERWLSFDAFYDDVAPGYAPGLTLDRIDVDGHYEPGNVRWATWEEQSRNKRCNVWVATEEGVMLLADAVARFGQRKEFMRGGSARMDRKAVQQ